MGRRKNALLAVIQALLTVVLCAPDEPEEPRLQEIPVGADILFASNRDTGGRRKEIYSMAVQGGSVYRITTTGEHHFLVGASASRRYLLVTRIDEDTQLPAGLGDEDRKNLWLLDVETKAETRLTDRAATSEGDSFSPDEEWIVFFMAVSGESQGDIYKIRKDGTALTRLTFTPSAVEGDPTWSPDGQKIAFICFSADTQRFVLKEMDTAGNNVRTIYDGNDSIATPYFQPGVYDPSYSPDGQWIVFEKPLSHNGENGNAGIWHVFKIRPDGTGLADLSLAGGHADRAEYLPSFSPDGQSVVFSARYGSSDPAQVRIDVFTMDTAGRSLQQLTGDPAYDDFAVWIR